MFYWFHRYTKEIIRILENAYKDTFVSANVCGELSDQFKKILGVLQGCISTLIFKIFLELIIAAAMEDEETEIGMQIGDVGITNLCFAKNTSLLNDLQAMVNRVVEVSEKLGMKYTSRRLRDNPGIGCTMILT